MNFIEIIFVYVPKIQFKISKKINVQQCYLGLALQKTENRKLAYSIRLNKHL